MEEVDGLRVWALIPMHSMLLGYLCMEYKEHIKCQACLRPLRTGLRSYEFCI